ncbi:MAG: hypothetical protein JXA50_08775 [Deltaproteobacteria bacterium]|nr:hypothetical protein [Deltaproteobacteria bacterium]
MKLFLKKTTLFIGFTVIFYSFCTILWGLYFSSALTKNINHRIGSYGHMNSRIKDLKSHGNVDILFLGSSHAYRGFDPRIFKKNGINVFNLGSSSQTPIQTEILVNRYLELLSPKLVIYEVYPGTFSSDGIESAMDIIANDKNDIDIIKMALKFNHIKVYNTLLYDLFREAFSLDSDFVEDAKKGDDTYIEGGFVEKKLAYYDEMNSHPARSWNLRQDQLNSFERILKRLRGKEVDVVLVQIPLTSSLYNSYLNNLEVDSYFSGLDNYYNFNELIELSDNQYFYDAHHLNQAGVEIFNRELLKILKNDGILKNHGL